MKKLIKISALLLIVSSAISAYATQYTITFNVVNKTSASFYTLPATFSFVGNCGNGPDNNSIICTTDANGKISFVSGLYMNDIAANTLTVSSQPNYAGNNFVIGNGNDQYLFTLSTTKWDDKSNANVILTITETAKK